jgi:hypothetical protein
MPSSKDTDDTKNDTPALRGPEFGEILRAFIGFDVDVLVTIRDLILHPVRVARDALNSNKETYLGQVRLFIFLLGIQTLFFALLQVYDNVTVESLLVRGADMESYRAAMAAKGISFAQINEALKGWFNLLVTPINLTFIVIFSLFFKMISPKTTIFGHALLYITANNAATFINVPLVFGAILITGNTTFSNLLSTPIQFFYIGLFVWVFMRQTVIGGIIKLILSGLTLVLAITLSGIIIWGVMNVLIANKFGTAPLQFMIQNAMEKARTEQSVTP